MDYSALQWAIHHIVDDVVRRLPDLDVSEVREYLDHNELGLAMDELAGVLLEERVPLNHSERQRFGVLLAHFDSGDRMPAGTRADIDQLGAALDRHGEPLTVRGLPPLRGGHLAGDDRPGATAFPVDWDDEDLRRAAERLDGPEVILANDRRWRTGTVDEVGVGVLRDVTGALCAVVPLPGPGVLRRRLRFTSLLSCLVGEFHRHAKDALDAAAPWIEPAELDALRALRDTGEFDEFADALAARVLTVPRPLPDPLRRAIRRVLLVFDLPVEGCAFVDDRDAILARLEQG